MADQIGAAPGRTRKANVRTGIISASSRKRATRKKTKKFQSKSKSDLLRRMRSTALTEDLVDDVAVNMNSEPTFQRSVAPSHGSAPLAGLNFIPDTMETTHTYIATDTSSQVADYNTPWAVGFPIAGIDLTTINSTFSGFHQLSGYYNSWTVKQVAVVAEIAVMVVNADKFFHGQFYMYPSRTPVNASFHQTDEYIMGLPNCVVKEVRPDPFNIQDASIAAVWPIGDLQGRPYDPSLDTKTTTSAVPGDEPWYPAVIFQGGDTVSGVDPTTIRMMFRIRVEALVEWSDVKRQT